MKAADIRVAADAEGIPRLALCGAAQVILPVLKRLNKQVPFLLRWATALLIRGFEDYVEEECG